MLRQLARRLSTTPTVVTSRAAGPIAVLSVDDGKANAFTQPMVEQLNSALDDCTDAGAVVIVGNAKALSAGFDLNVMSDALSGRAAPSDEACTLYASSFELMLRCAAFPRPLVLANRGHALALGGIWLHCADYRIGPSDRPDAKIGIPRCDSATCSRASPSSSAVRASRRPTSFAPPPSAGLQSGRGGDRRLSRSPRSGRRGRAAALKVAEDLVPLRYAFNTVKEYERSALSTAAAAASSTTSRPS